MFYALASRNLEIGYGYRFSNEAFFSDNASTAIRHFADKAKNGEVLVGKFGEGVGNLIMGLFYGKRVKPLFTTKAVFDKDFGDWKRWVFAACNSIGDQSSVAELQTEAIRQGHRIKSLTIPFEHFEHFVLTLMKDPYQNTIKARSEWRFKNKIVRDCRTYVGQPDRNMILRRRLQVA